MWDRSSRIDFLDPQVENELEQRTKRTEERRPTEAADGKVREYLLELRDPFLFFSLPYCWVILGK